MSGLFSSARFGFRNQADKAKKSIEKEGERSDGGQSADTAEKSTEKERELSDGGRSSKLSSVGSSETLLVNETDKKLLLKDKIGGANGVMRYKIPGGGSMKVNNLPHSRFRMIAYAINKEEEGGEDGEHSSSSNEAHRQGSHKKKTKQSIDTKLSIHSDQLRDSWSIVISFDESEYKIHFDPR